jgi:SNF2 family DNA or RNA helicase
MGLGKTRQVLAAAYHLAANRILIACPAGARAVWSLEIQRWLPAWSPRVFVMEPGVNTAQVQKRLADPSPLILVIAYDELSKMESKLPAYLAQAAWDLLIIDEAHYLKNFSNRTKALYGPAGDNAGIQASCARTILLTGTPTPNHAGELWQHVRTFWPGTITTPRKGRPMTQPEFEERYTRYRDTVFGRQVTGSKNQAELRNALSHVVLRRRKDQVLPELPPLILQDIPLSEPRDLRLTPAAQSLAGRLTWSLSRLSEARIDAAVLTVLHTPDAQITTLRRELGELKVQPTILWVQERMHSTNKMLIFAWHHSVIEHLRRGLEEFNPVTITGETSPVGRANAIDMFQHRPGVRVFIGQVLAAGTAITLTAASEVAIVEPSWVPGENVQAICRAHRLGQRDSVLASFLYLPGTLDQRIMSTFRRKAAEISELQGDDLHASAAHDVVRRERDARHSQPAGDDHPRRRQRDGGQRVGRESARSNAGV